MRLPRRGVLIWALLLLAAAGMAVFVLRGALANPTDTPGAQSAAVLAGQPDAPPAASSDSGGLAVNGGGQSQGDGTQAPVGAQATGNDHAGSQTGGADGPGTGSGTGGGSVSDSGSGPGTGTGGGSADGAGNGNGDGSGAGTGSGSTSGDPGAGSGDTGSGSAAGGSSDGGGVTVGQGTATPELPSGLLVAVGLAPLLGLALLARRRRGDGIRL